jgi:hypothetical protein|tara:strand:- start:107 stop:661 length:555 start_codon:yes stop_codon:yes gene_type:complete
MADEGFVARTGEVSISKLNAVTNEKGRTAADVTNNYSKGSSDTASIKDLHDWFHSNAHLAESDNANPVSFSEFHKGQVLTGSVSSTNESSSTYSNADDGTITMWFDTDTVVPDGDDTKQYQVSIDSGGSFTTDVDGTYQFTGINSGSYTVVWKDGFTTSTVTTAVHVTLAGGSKTYLNVQRLSA